MRGCPSQCHAAAGGAAPLKISSPIVLNASPQLQDHPTDHPTTYLPKVFRRGSFIRTLYSVSFDFPH
eukprot:2997685-Prymnesium_polylepis.1